VAVLSDNSYGKSRVRLTKIVRNGAHHELLEMSVDILLTGDFAASYTEGNNAKVIATDSMKNTVYVLAKENKFTSIEEFAELLARHFAKTYAQVKSAAIVIRQPTWQRLSAGGKPHTHAFVDGGHEDRVCRATIEGQTLTLSGGLSGLRLLKTTGSEFRDFVLDCYRTLKDTSDRIFATSVEAEWAYAGEACDFNATFTAARQAIIRALADEHSLGAQQTLLAMGKAMLADCPAIASIQLTLPNLHRIPFNLEPFGLKNENEIFVPVDEPHGTIKGFIERD
jgi:urate oxidase